MSAPGCIVVVGASAGGLRALAALLSLRARWSDLAMAMALHVHKEARMTYTALPDIGAPPLPIREALDKEPLVRGTLLMAPAGYHMLLEREGHVSLSVEEPVHWSRPSIDVLFESAAFAYGPRALGILLTGANDDGAAGLRALANAGARTFVQDPSEAEVPDMPRAALAAHSSHTVFRFADADGPLVRALDALPSFAFPA